MHIAILGAGYAGIATAWYLARAGAKVTVYDPAGIAGGASGMAAGLLHPYMGLDAKRAWRADEALQCTRQLLEAAQPHALSPIIRSQGIVRLAYSDRQHNSYFICSQQHDDVTWWDSIETAAHLSAVTPTSAIYIQGGWSIDSHTYVSSLWAACRTMNCTFVQKAGNPNHLAATQDAVVVAAGYTTQALLPEAVLPLRPVKGQLVQLPWPAQLPPLTHPVNSHVYIIMSSDNKTCLVGATYEKVDDSEVDLSVAWAELKPKAAKIIPRLADQIPINGWAGVRCSTPQHLPVMGCAHSNVWYLAGFGSKGLLYHGLYAQELAQKLLCAGSDGRSTLI